MIAPMWCSTTMTAAAPRMPVRAGRWPSVAVRLMRAGADARMHAPLIDHRALEDSRETGPGLTWSLQRLTSRHRAAQIPAAPAHRCQTRTQSTDIGDGRFLPSRGSSQSDVSMLRIRYWAEWETPSVVR